MIKSIFVNKQQCCFIITVLFLVFGVFKSLAQQKTELVLQNEHLSITPKEFYIADVIDERANRSTVAWLLPAASTESNQHRTYPVDLQGGGLTAIKQFIDHNLARNTALRPVVISIKKFTTTETPLARGLVEGHISLVLSLYMKGEEDASLIGGQHLADYNGSAIYNRNAGPPQEIEPTLRHVLENGLIYLNNWMNRQANNNIKLAKGVKVTFSDFMEKPEGDTIYYSFKRPLTWDDFKSKVPSNKFDAEVSPSIGYDEQVDVINAIINIKMAIRVSLPKSACWVKSGGGNDYTLNHEQRHFDIAKIAAERFKRKIAAEVLPVNNFDGQINMEYLDAYREMDNLQKQYDTETRHGGDQIEQQRWNEKIDKELKSLVIGH